MSTPNFSFNDKKSTTTRVNAQIKAIGETVKMTKARVQETCVEIAAHVYQHGDVTLYNKLFKVTKSLDRTALVSWIQAYGFAELRKDGTFGKLKTAVADSDYADGDAVYADYTDNADIPSWFEFSASAADIVKTLDVAGKLKGIVRQLIKEQDPESANKVVVDFAEINESVEAMLNACRDHQKRDVELQAKAKALMPQPQPELQFNVG